jgi:capsular exopolysaccharide synthesis family protein
MSSVIGVFLGVVLTYFMEYMDATISTPERVWRAVGLTPLGVVPDLAKLKPRLIGFNSAFTRLGSERMQTTSKELIASHHPLSVITDSYWTIRAGLLLARGEKRSQIFLLTSPSPGDGKTVTTLNLATILARDGHDVLVIDGDLRRGTCHTRIGLNNKPGLANLLSGEISLQDVIQKTFVTGLSLISRGACHTNPSELLVSKQMRELLANVRDSFDFVLIDSPPIIAIPDASVLSAMVDGVLFVLNSTQSTFASARKAMERLESVEARVLGVILNKIDVRNPDYAYYREYYGSSYGTVEDEERRSYKDSSANGLQPATQIKDFSFAELASASVPNEFIEFMTEKLREFAGPAAPIIVHDSIHILGESSQEFPISRFDELIKQIGQEILNDDFRKRFEEQMINQLKSSDASGPRMTRPQ